MYVCVLRMHRFVVRLTAVRISRRTIITVLEAAAAAAALYAQMFDRSSQRSIDGGGAQSVCLNCVLSSLLDVVMSRVEVVFS